MIDVVSQERAHAMLQRIRWQPPGKSMKHTKSLGKQQAARSKEHSPAGRNQWLKDELAHESYYDVGEVFHTMPQQKLRFVYPSRRVSNCANKKWQGKVCVVLLSSEV